jgi:proline iminopeptidase
LIRPGIYIVCFLLIRVYSYSTELYSKAYGNPTHPAIVFFHGGPGYNSVNFEFSSAEDLVKKGFYVVVFDQRGCGRSKEYKPDNSFSFEDQIGDIISVFSKHNIKKASLIGHSWGGTLATKFAEKHPDKVERIIFIGAPMSYQLSFKGILKRCEEKFSAAKDSVNLKRIAHVRKQDTATLAYSGTCFMLAMANGFYAPAEKSEFSESFKKKMESNENRKYLTLMETEPVQGVYASEKYILLDVYKNWLELRKTIPLFAFYGSEDGLFDQKQLDLIKEAVTPEHFHLVKGASHNVFIDKHEEFLSLISKTFN